PIALEAARRQVRELEANCAEFGVELLGLTHSERGIVHIIGPELGLTQPGKTVVCGDSHTSTHGALGALAFGIGTTEVGHVLATQCLLQRKPRTFAINVAGRLRTCVTAKDLILAIIGAIPERKGDTAFETALIYMGLEAGAPIKDQPVNVVFVGSCTNARLSDLRSAAAVLRGRKIATGVHMLVVPGSQQVKKQAE